MGFMISGVFKTVTMVVGDALIGTLTGLWKLGVKYLPPIFKPFIEGNGKDAVLPEIKISMVAPSGFGKTTLLATVVEKIQRSLSSGITVQPIEDSDILRLNNFKKSIVDIIKNGKAASSITEFNSVQGTSDSHNFRFEIVLSDEKGNKIIQPFNIMDIPGGWIDPHKRPSAIGEKWNEFMSHLEQSALLWLPIDSGILSEHHTSEEKSIATALLDTVDIKDLVSMWANNRTSDEEASLCYIPVKCESYYSKDKSATRNKAAKLRVEFRKMYAGIFDVVKEKKNDKNVDIRQYFAPVETIGSIYLATTDWDNEQRQFIAEYKVDGDDIKITGADQLLKLIYQQAYHQIKQMEDTSDKQIENLKKDGVWKNMKEINELKKAAELIKGKLKPLVQEFRSFTNVSLDEITDC